MDGAAESDGVLIHSAGLQALGQTVGGGGFQVSHMSHVGSSPFVQCF